MRWLTLELASLDYNEDLPLGLPEPLALLKPFSSFKCRILAGRNLDPFCAAWPDPGAGTALSNVESAEYSEPHLHTPSNQRVVLEVKILVAGRDPRVSNNRVQYPATPRVNRTQIRRCVLDTNGRQRYDTTTRRRCPLKEVWFWNSRVTQITGPLNV